MTTTHHCDICHKNIKDGKTIIIWGGVISSLDICLSCWVNQEKWQQIHKIKKLDQFDNLA